MKTPPPASAISKTSSMIRRLLTSELVESYRVGWYDTLDSLRGAGLERQAPSAEGPGYADPTGEQLVEVEARRRSLYQASEKLEKAWELTRDAKGLIDYASGKESSGVKDGAIQNWTKQEMDALNGVVPPYKGRVRAG